MVSLGSPKHGGESCSDPSPVIRGPQNEAQTRSAAQIREAAQMRITGGGRVLKLNKYGPLGMRWTETAKRIQVRPNWQDAMMWRAESREQRRKESCWYGSQRFVSTSR
jgi:hypothetical protein